MMSLAGLSEVFGNTSNPQYFIASHTHTDALKLLSSSPPDGRNVRVVIAEPGLGKTILLLSLLERFRPSALTVHLFWTQLGRGEFLRYFLSELGVVHPASAVREAQDQLTEVLEREFRQHRKVIVGIDEAHDLHTETLCELAEVLDCNSARSKDLEVVLAGLPSLSGKLVSPQLQKLWDRTSEITTLVPLTREETASYIHGRLEVSGYREAIHFTPDAISTIATLTEGIPRNINNLCCASLLLATERSRATIDSSTVTEARASWEGRSIARKPLDEELASPVPALRLSPIDQRTCSSTQPPISRVNAQDAGGDWDNPTSVCLEPAGGSRNKTPTAGARPAWAGRWGAQAAAVEAREVDLAHALQQHCDELLRKLRRLEQTGANKTRPGDETGTRESSREPEPTTTIAAQHEPSALAAAAPAPQLHGARGCEEEPPSNPRSATGGPGQQGKIAPAPTAASEAPDHASELLRTNSQGWSERHEFRLRRMASAPLIVLVVILVGIGAAYRPVAKRKDAFERWGHQLKQAIAATKPTLKATTQRHSPANVSTSGAAGNFSGHEQLPPGEPRQSLMALRRKGVGLDLARDMRGFDQAAVSGDPDAQFELGTAYAYGRGVPADAVTAYTWLALAFANGKPQAGSLLRELTRQMNEPDIARIRWNLGQMYANGIGVAADKITAYKWHLLAASAGETRSRSAQAELAATMTRDEVYQAQVRARAWLNRHRRQGPF
ncbi:MAG: AAA family ATPase [Acidobacteria bacterium]|nr:AAA family ATPase [Acidobacteriota bacterium]